MAMMKIRMTVILTMAMMMLMAVLAMMMIVGWLVLALADPMSGLKP